MTYIMTEEQMRMFEKHLRLEEHSASTILKYASAIRDFYDFLPPDKEVSKELLLEWKERISVDHAASTVNVMISAVNSFFAFLCWNDLHIRQIKTQRQIYRNKERELTRAEYMRLLNAARDSGNMRLFYLMQTLGATGIRISELRFISVEAITSGSATVDCKFPRNCAKRCGPTVRKRALSAALSLSRNTAIPSTVPTSGGNCSGCVQPPMWTRTRFFPTTSVICSPSVSISWKKTWQSWRTSLAMQVLTQRASTLWRAAQNTSVKWSVLDWSYRQRNIDSVVYRAGKISFVPTVTSRYDSTFFFLMQVPDGKNPFRAYFFHKMA